MPETLRPRVLVLGGGPGGYVAAIRAGQLGLDTVLVEAGRLGGTCLIRGCIPSKALIHAADRFADMAGNQTLGIACKQLGRGVTVVEAADRILPRYDEALTRPVRRWLTRTGVELHLGAKVGGLDGEGRLAVETAAGPLALAADKILVTIGRQPLTEGWGLDEMALDRAGPFVKVDDQCKTAMRGVWAIGDLVGEPMLAHKAMAQGAMVAEIIAGQHRHFDPAGVAAIVFTDPEIVVAGMLPDDAASAGIDAAVSVFPFAASGRALTLEAGAGGGVVPIVSRRHAQRILGIQAVGQQIAELAGEFAHALAMGAVLDDVA